MRRALVAGCAALAVALLVFRFGLALPHWLDAARRNKLHERSARFHYPTLQLPTLTALPAETGGELRGVWIHVSRPQDWDQIARKLKAAGFNAIFLRVARGGEALYPSQLLPQEPWARALGRDELAAAVAAAHRHGLQLHAWKVCFHLGSLRRHARTDQHAARLWQQLQRDNRLVRNSRGQPAHWLNPADPRNVQLEVDVAREVVSRYAVDGYHLDYIRYPDEPSFDFDYGPVSASEFARFLGRVPEPWPGSVRRGVLHAAYTAWQRDRVTEAVRAIATAVRSARPGTLVSAAVWRNIALHSATVKQDWPRWTREGLLDFVVLMNYEKTLDRFHEELENALMWNDGARPLIAGIGSWRLSPEDVLAQVQLSRALGADGFVLFSYNADRIDQQLALLRDRACSVPTVPGLAGPPLRFRAISDVFKNRYTHTLFPKNVPLRLVVHTDSEPAATVRGRLRVRTLDGRAVLEASVRLDPSTEARLTLPAVDAPVQIEFRGVADIGDRRRVPYVRHSGWFVPVGSADFHQWQATRVPPVAGPETRLIGVYAYGQGAARLYAVLRERWPARIVAIHELSMPFLSPLSILVLSPLTDLREVDGRLPETLRRWVASGGTIVLVGNAIGRHWYPVLFPEVGSSGKMVRHAVIRWLGQGPAEHPCRGHLTVVPGRAGQVVATAAADEAVLVSGRFGQGTVWLVGFTVDDLLADEALCRRVFDRIAAVP